jgi:hypothetical protein
MVKVGQCCGDADDAESLDMTNNENTHSFNSNHPAENNT